MKASPQRQMHGVTGTNHGAARQEHAEELLDRGKEPFGWYSMGQAFPGRRPCRSGDIAHVFATFSVLHGEIG